MDTYLIGEWVLVDRRTIGTSLVPIEMLAEWMAMWGADVVLSVNATLYVPAGTLIPDVVAAYEWHINADNVRERAA